MELTPARTLVLALRDARTDPALRTGWLNDGAPEPGPKLRVVARKLLSGPGADPDPQVLFEVLDPAMARPVGLSVWLQAIRAFSLTATGTPCLAILLLLVHQHRALDVAGALSALIGVLLLQVAINVFNDVEDYRRLIDLPGTLGGSGVIQAGWQTPVAQARLAWAAFGLGALAGLLAVWREPRFLVPIAALGGLGTLGYSARRIGLKYVALGDVAVFLLCGPALTAGYAMAAGHELSAGALWLGAFFGFLAVAILHVNNLQDLKLDRQRGVRTLAIWLGFRGSLRLLALLYAAAALVLVLGVGTHALPPFTLSGLLPLLGVGVPWVRSVSAALGPESALLANCRVRSAQIHLLSGLALIFGLALATGLEKFGL